MSIRHCLRGIPRIHIDQLASGQWWQLVDGGDKKCLTTLQAILILHTQAILKLILRRYSYSSYSLTTLQALLILTGLCRGRLREAIYVIYSSSPKVLVVIIAVMSVISYQYDGFHVMTVISYQMVFILQVQIALLSL